MTELKHTPMPRIALEWRCTAMKSLLEVIADAAKDAIADSVEPAFARETEKRCRALLKCLEGNEE